MDGLPSFLAVAEDERVEAFLDHWYAPARHEAAPVDETRPDVPFPVELRRHHELLGRWDVSRNRNYRLLHPSDIGWSDIDPPDVVVFLEEDQGVEERAFDASGHVWAREVDDGVPWQPVAVALGTFLLIYELAEAAFGWSDGWGASCAWMRREDVERLVAQLPPLPLPAWSIGSAPHHLYGSDDALALVEPNPFGSETPDTATGWEVRVSGRRPGALAWMADLEGVVGTEGWRDREQLAGYDGIVWDSLRLF